MNHKRKVYAFLSSFFQVLVAITRVIRRARETDDTKNTSNLYSSVKKEADLIVKGGKYNDKDCNRNGSSKK